MYANINESFKNILSAALVGLGSASYRKKCDGKMQADPEGLLCKCREGRGDKSDFFYLPSCPPLPFPAL